jgi:hypothetical protein
MPFIDPAGYSSVGYSSIGYSVTFVEPSIPGPEVPLTPITEVGFGTGRRFKIRTMELLRSQKPNRILHTKQYVGSSVVSLTIGRLYLSRSTVTLTLPRTQSQKITAETVRTHLGVSHIQILLGKGVALQPSRVRITVDSALMSSVSMLKLSLVDSGARRLRRLQKAAEITSILI